jgi:hypothetical protein
MNTVIGEDGEASYRMGQSPTFAARGTFEVEENRLDQGPGALHDFYGGGKDN